MPRRVVILIAVVLIGIGAYALLGNTDDPIFDKDSWSAQLGSLPNADNSPRKIKSLIDALEDSKDGDVYQKDIQEIESKAADALDEGKEKLDELIDDLSKEGAKSEEAKEWQNDLRNCMESLRDSLDAADSIDKNNSTQIHKEIENSEACRQTANSKIASISDDDEKRDAEKQSRTAALVIGTIMIIVGVAMLIYGDPTGAGLKLLAGGVAMVACALDSDGICEGVSGKEGSTGGSASQEVQSNPSKYELTDEQKDEGYVPVGRSASGDAVFLHSEPEKRWMVVKISTKDEILNAAFANTDEYLTYAPSADALGDCNVKYSVAERTVEFRKSTDASKCPNFSIQQIPDEPNRWRAESLDEAPIQ